MKRFRVTFKDGRMTFVEADRYARDKDRHVFYTVDEEVAFFAASEIAGVEHIR